MKIEVWGADLGSDCLHGIWMQHQEGDCLIYQGRDLLILFGFHQEIISLQTRVLKLGQWCSQNFAWYSRFIHIVTLSLGPSLTLESLFHPQFECVDKKVSEIGYCSMKLGIHSQDMQDFMTSHSMDKCEKWQGAISPLHFPLTQMSGMLLWLFCVTTLICRSKYLMLIWLHFLCLCKILEWVFPKFAQAISFQFAPITTSL